MSAAGRRRHFVILEDKETNVLLTPSSLYVNLIPGGPSELDEERNVFTVEAPYHPRGSE